MKPGKRQIHVLLIWITVVVAAIWIRAYWFIPVSLFPALIFFNHRSYSALKNRVHALPKKRRYMLEWMVSILVASWLGYLFVKFFFGLYPVASSAMLPNIPMTSVWIADKFTVGAMLDSGKPSDKARTHALRKFRNNDIVLIKKPVIARDSLTPSTPATDVRQNIAGGNSKEVLALRIIGLPGDSVQIKAGQVWVNGARQKESPGVSNEFAIRKEVSPAISHQIMERALKVYTREGVRMVKLLINEVEENNWNRFLIRELDYLNYPDPQIFPFRKGLLWNKTFLGPLYLPKKGDTILLTHKNLWIYGALLSQYEQIDFDVPTLLGQTEPAQPTTHTVQSNYYWVLGDNRANSFDSRYFGPIPEKYIVGIAAIQISK